MPGLQMPNISTDPSTTPTPWQPKQKIDPTSGQQVVDGAPRQGWDWVDKYKSNPNEFLDWYNKNLDTKNGYQWGGGTDLWNTPWGNKNEMETADIMAKELLPQLSQNDMQSKYKNVTDRLSAYPEWLTPQLSRAQADVYRSGDFQNQAFQPYRRQVLQDLAANQKATKQSLMARGLRSGGLAQGQIANLVRGASGELAKGKQDIAQQGEDLAQETETNALNSAIQLRNMQQTAYDSVYNNALQNYMGRKNSNKAIGRGVGMVGGALLGGYFSGGNPYGVAGGGAAGGAAGEGIGGLM